MKKVFLLISILLILLSGCSIASEPKQNEEYELLNISVYTKNQTNTFGAIIHSEEWIKYAFSVNGNIVTKDRNFDGLQKDKYRLHKSEDGKAKIIDSSDSSNASLDFYLTDKMQENLYAK